MVILGIDVAPAWAAEPARIDVDGFGCARLDRVLLESSTRLELRSEAESPLMVRYACDGPALTIAIESQAAGARIVRRVAGGWNDDVEPERTAALLAVGLFRAAHALLRPADAPPPPSGVPSAKELASVGVHVEPLPGPGPVATAPSVGVAPAPPPVVVTRPITAPSNFAPPAFVQPPRAAPADVPAKPRAGDRPHEIGAGAGVRAHNTADLIPLLALALHYRYWPISRVGVGPVFSAELGSAGRVGGDVAVRIFQLGVSGALRMVEAGPFQLLGELQTTAAVVQLEGEATVDGFSSEELVGGTGNVGAFVVPSVGVAGTHVGLALGAGYLFRAPRGSVDGDAAVQVDGVWLSASVAVQLGLGKRKSANGATP